MKLTLDENDARYLVHECTNEYIRVNDSVHSSSLILAWNQLVPDWEPRTAEEIIAQHIEQLVRTDPEVILLGTGLKLTFPAPDILQAAYSHNIGIEVMDTAAACRTFNMLSADRRKVVAGLII